MESDEFIFSLVIMARGIVRGCICLSHNDDSGGNVNEVVQDGSHTSADRLTET